MLISFKDKTIIVTGAARGIGKNIATQFAEVGATVVIVDKNEKDGESVVDEISSSGYKAEYYKLDLADIKQSEEMIIFRIKANRFLQHMVRYLVGTMLDVSRGRYTVLDFNNLLKNEKTIAVVVRAPAQGLYLKKVYYD